MKMLITISRNGNSADGRRREGRESCGILGPRDDRIIGSPKDFK
jgi:hypothetical protein